MRKQVKKYSVEEKCTHITNTSSVFPFFFVYDYIPHMSYSLFPFQTWSALIFSMVHNPVLFRPCFSSILSFSLHTSNKKVVLALSYCFRIRQASSLFQLRQFVFYFISTTIVCQHSIPYVYKTKVMGLGSELLLLCWIFCFISHFNYLEASW